MKIIDWTLEVYKICILEIKYLCSLKRQEIAKKEKVRIQQLFLFNILMMIVYSLFLIGAIVVLISMIFVQWQHIFLFLYFLLLAYIVRVMQRRYLKRRDAFIKNDSSLIKD